jgi:hypothetical protein
MFICFKVLIDKVKRGRERANEPDPDLRTSHAVQSLSNSSKVCHVNKGLYSQQRATETLLELRANCVKKKKKKKPFLLAF